MTPGQASASTQIFMTPPPPPPSSSTAVCRALQSSAAIRPHEHHPPNDVEVPGCVPGFTGIIRSMTNFSGLNLSGPLQRALAEVGYAQMTPVQAASLPPILSGRDVITQARTGSGKTAAFALGLLSRLDATQVR